MTSKEVINKIDKFTFSNYSRYPIAIKKAKGSWVWNFEGKKYLDFTTGIAVSNLGHNHIKIINSIKQQTGKLIHTSNLFYTQEQGQLAQTLVQNSFADKVFFCNTGTEANEAALKLARKWGKANGGKYKIIAAKGGFHGRTYGSLSVTGNRIYRKDFNPMVPGIKFVEYGKPEEISDALIDDRYCAVILEPIQGEYGVIIPPRNYFKEVRKICNLKNVLLIIDEIQVGMGRTGKLFAYQDLGFTPDIMTLAKALGGGLPCGAILAKNKIASYLKPGTHGSTMGGNPLVMKVGCTVINSLLGEGILDNVSKLGLYFLDRLKIFQNKYNKIIKDVRGRGFILGIELINPQITNDLVKSLYENGLLTIITEKTVIRILPPLNANKYEIDHAIKVLEKSIKEVLNA
jgi:predicted acetylornithine/succinylornithine family transaminase